MLILDTDAASVLAKGRLLDEVLELFEEHRTVITPRIEEELEKPLQYGYSYPDRIFDKIDTEVLTEDERKQYREWFKEQTVDRGELEATALADSRDAIIFTLDRAAARYAEKQDVQTLAFNNLAKLLLQKSVISEEELRNSIERIERKDNREIDIEEILE